MNASSEYDCIFIVCVYSLLCEYRSTAVITCCSCIIFLMFKYPPLNVLSMFPLSNSYIRLYRCINVAIKTRDVCMVIVIELLYSQSVTTSEMLTNAILTFFSDCYTSYA